MAVAAEGGRDTFDRSHRVKDFGSNPNSFHQIMKDLEKENKRLKRFLSVEQANRKKVERKLRINKRENQQLTTKNQQLTMENQQLKRQI